MNRMIDIFSTLGDRLSHFGKDSTSQEVMRRAMEENHWFSQSDILMAIEAIREEFLDRDKLQKWAAAYTMTEPRRVDFTVELSTSAELHPAKILAKKATQKIFFIVVKVLKS